MLKINSLVLAANLFMLVLISNGCSSSTELVSSWRDPNAAIKFDSLHKVLVIAALQDNYNRKFTENRFAARLGNAGVQSYTYFDLKELKEKKDYFIKKFKEEHFDGAIIVRVVSSDTEVKASQTIPTYYLDYWNFYDYYTDFTKNQGRLSRDETFKIEVNVYSFETNKLIWTGLTSLVNPSSDLDKTVQGVADVVGKKMREENFIIQ